MSEIITTGAVVLRAVKFRESSSITTFFTEKAGKVAGMVRGARRKGNRFGPSLQPMSHVNIVLYRKSGREIQTVSQCDLEETFRRIPGDLGRIETGMQIVELVNLLTHGEEENIELFRLLVDSLKILDSELNPGQFLLYHFELEFLRILGFRLDFNHCGRCGRSGDQETFGSGKSIRFDIRSGGPVCSRCATGEGRIEMLSRPDFDALRVLSRSRIGQIETAPNILTGSGENIQEFLENYFRYHIPGYRGLRSAEVFRRVNAPDESRSGGVK